MWICETDEFMWTCHESMLILHRNPGFYHETDEFMWIYHDSMWILYRNPGLNPCGFVTEIQYFNDVNFHTYKTEIIVNFDTYPLG